jgi:SnoaL-like domain
MANVEQRLARAEAMLAIMRLKAQYASFADAKYTEDHQKKPVAERDAIAMRQAECFTEDGLFDAGSVGGVARGRPAIFENFRAKPLLFAMHMFTNPDIDVAAGATTASGRWMHYLLITPDTTRLPIHAMGFTDDTYRLTGGNWLFSSVVVRFGFVVPFGTPWTAPA